MSFYSNFQSDKCPGVITGNPMNGLVEKVCVQAEKIFDAGIKQTQLEDYTLTLTGFTPENPTYPLTFVSARSQSAEATVTGVTIDRRVDKHCARVQATVSVPMEVAYVDAAGVEGTATATITLPQDVLMFVPAPSIMPFEVKAVVSAVAPDGTFVADPVGFTVGLFVNWILSVNFVFQQVENKEQVKTKKSFLTFTVIGIIGLVINSLGMLLVPLFPMLMFFGSPTFLGTEWAWWIMKTLMTAIVLVWNYIGRKLFIFK